MPLRKNRDLDERMADLWKERVLNELEAYREWNSGMDRRRGVVRRRGRDREYRRLFQRWQEALERELDAAGGINRRSGRAVEPPVRELLRELLEDAPFRGTTVEELARACRSGNGFRLLSPESNFTGAIILLLLFALLLPGVRAGLRPVMKKMVAGALGLSEQLQAFLTTFREEMEDIMAEAQFSRLAESLGPEKNE